MFSALVSAISAGADARRAAKLFSKSTFAFHLDLVRVLFRLSGRLGNGMLTDFYVYTGVGGGCR